jgi:hypothetical protein
MWLANNSTRQGEECGSLAGALGRPQLDAALVGSLDLAHCGQLLAEEVDVVDLSVCRQPKCLRSGDASSRPARCGVAQANWMEIL